MYDEDDELDEDGNYFDLGRFRRGCKCLKE
jgi:hypothetical protein